VEDSMLEQEYKEHLSFMLIIILLGT